MALIHTKLDSARQELLDLGLRNTLINYRPLKSRGIEIIDELPQEIFRILVQEGRKMSFLSMPEEMAERAEGQEGFVELFTQPEEDESDVSARHLDNKLQTPYTSAKLQRRLLNTYYAARTFIEEQGVNVLYIALGMLEWYESPSSDVKRRAPLILIPAELSRTSVQAMFRVRYTEDDIGDNLSLIAKLRSEFDIALPLISSLEEFDVSSYFDDIEETISNYSRWTVDRGVAALGFFSFGKFLMYNDLDVTQWPEEVSPSKHRVIQALLDEGFETPDARLDKDAHLDSHLNPEEVYHVMDADGSQTLAMLDVKQGHNLVIQGPPGTGKSQTITNLIAEAIGQRKTVLFVSEKMAALEVVKRRLDNIHMGDACLKLHSHNTRKNSVLKELERTLRLGEPKLEEFEQDLSVLLNTRKHLNAYCEAVNTTIGESGVSPYHAYGRLVRLQQLWDSTEPPIVDTASMRMWTAEAFKRREEIAERLQALLAKMGTPSNHPFWGSRRKVFLPTEKPQILRAVQEALEAIKHLREAAASLSDQLGLKQPADRTDADVICRAARRAMESPNLKGIQLDTRTWRERKDDLFTLLQAGSRFEKLHEVYDSLLIPEAWDQNVLELRQHLVNYGEKWWRFLVGDFRRAKNKLAGLCQHPLPKAASERTAIADAIIEAHRLKADIAKRASFGKELFGAQWQEEESDWDVLQQITQWMQELYANIEIGEIPKGILAFLSGDTDPNALEPAVSKVEGYLAEQAKKIQNIIDCLEFDSNIRFGEDSLLLLQSFEIQAEILQTCSEQIDRLQEIVAYNHQTVAMIQEQLSPILNLAANWPYAYKHLTDALRFNWFNGLVERAMQERPVLAQFDGATHEQVLTKFRQLDGLSLKYNRARLALAHWKALPRQGIAGQMGVLRREFEKKRRHLPIRQLMQQAGHAIQAIKPVFMMSPMSIATYLPPSSVTFELVIFDEASQVKPVDAFGAILRGRQTVVVGDSKQLPPTSFFDSLIEAEEEADTSTADMESILGLFNAKGASERMLCWHYRSRHESLITVSNQEFYNNRLVIFPSPDADRIELGVVYHNLPHTYYDRGGSRDNKGEAQAVAKSVMDHARNHPDWTLGVATFSKAQMEAVQNQLELLRRQDPTCEEFFNGHQEEPFFVKNLENVQGDERDVIYISIGYGRDANGYLTMNFGPLNQDGGERRLNVLITRARYRCEVFTNLRADDIDLNRTNSQGVQALKRYLQYAATGELALAVATGEKADSPFEEAVADALREQGCRVIHQVGTAGFRIDLAIVDDEHPGHYLLGIECDGATYHSARSARDRDRIRQSVLEGLGWQIHRIWSTDWFRNPKRELKKVMAAIEYAKARAGTPAASPERIIENSPPNLFEREELAQAMPEQTLASVYQVANLELETRFSGYSLHEIPTPIIAEWIQRVVEIESPVHLEEAARRIMASFGVNRMGRRIYEAMKQAAFYASRKGWIRRDEDFLFSPKQEKITVRDRSGLDNISRKINLIASAEIEAAIKEIVAKSYGISPEDISLEVCRLFGFAQTSENMRQRIQTVLNTMISNEQLTEKGGHLMIGISSDD